MPEDLVILTRVFDLLEWLVPQADSFPRSYRATVTDRLVGSALDFGEQLLEAQAHRGAARRARLAGADATLNKLRLYLRLAHRWQWLSNGQYEHVSRMVAELGRMLGGWLRQSAGSEPAT